MNPVIGWALAAIGVAAGWQAYGWQGVVLAVTVIVFWLLLQFSRALRVMKDAAGSPVGSVPSAVMLNARLKEGVRLLDILKLTRSLGERVGPPPAQPSEPESFRWRDAAGDTVTVELRRGQLTRWTLQRQAPADAPESAVASGDVVVPPAGTPPASA